MILTLEMRNILFRATPPFLRPHWKRLEASPLGSRLVKGAFWSFFGTAISRTLGLLASVLVGRMLGKEAFGQLGIIQGTVGLFGSVAGLGMGMAATKYVAEFKRKDPVLAGRIISVASATSWLSSGLMAIVLYATAPWLAKHTLAAPQLAPLLRAGSLLLIFGVVTGTQTGALSGFEAFKAVSGINLYVGLLSFPMMVGGAYLAGVKGAVWGLIGSNIINSYLNYTAVRREAARCAIPLSYSRCFQVWPMFWRFSLPLTLSGVVNSLVVWGAGAVLVNQPNGYEEMGIYQAVMRVKIIPETIVAMLLAPLLPVLSDAFGKRDTAAYHRALSFNYAICTAVIVPVSLLQASIPWLTLLPYGAAYAGHESVVRWLMFHAVTYGLLWPMGSTLTSMGHMWLQWLLNLLNVSVYLALCFLLVPGHGASGYAAAFAMGYVASAIPCVVFVYRKCGDALRSSGWLVTAILAFGCLGLCILSSFANRPGPALAFAAATALGFVGWQICQLRKSLTHSDPNA